MTILDRVARTNGNRAAVPRPKGGAPGRIAAGADARLGLARAARPFIRKVFPEH
jgi:hypothetical protein